MSLVEIDVVVSDDTGAGFASALAKYQAFKASLSGGIPLNVDLNTTAALAKLKALEAAGGSINIDAGINARGWTALANAMDRLVKSGDAAEAKIRFVNQAMQDDANVAERDVVAKTALVSAISSLGNRATTTGGFLGFLSNKVDLWGGALKGILPGWIAAASALHLIADGVVEVLGVVLPATIAMVAWGAAAAPTIGDIYTHMQQLNTVVTATGHAIYPLTGAFQAMQDAAKPSVYQLWGDALAIAGNKAGLFQQVVSDTGTALSQLGARFQNAMVNSSGLGVTMQYAAADVAHLGSIFGNLGGILGTVLRSVPGYAQVFLNLADGVTHVAEVVVGASQPLLQFGLAAHGAFLYAGLAATGFANIMPKLLGGISGFAEKASFALAGMTRLGPAGAAASRGMLGFATAAEGAAALPWGWIAIAVAGFGALVYWLATAKTATQQWTASLQAALNNAKAVAGLSLAMSDQVAIYSRLASAQMQMKSLLDSGTHSIQGASRAWQNGSPAFNQAKTDIAALGSAFQQIQGQVNTYNQRMGALAQTYHGMNVAQGLVIASGITWGQITSKQAGAMALVRAQVLATAKAYQSMGQVGGTLGADMSVINRLTSDQFTSMQKLDGMWHNFLALGTGLASNLVSVIQQMRTVDGEARKASTSFNGVNNASLSMRTNFAGLLNTVQSVVQGMRDAHAPASAMAAVIGTTLKTAVNAGALENQIFYQTAASMARQAGYTGNSIGQLRGFVDSNAVSTQKLSNITNQYGQNLTKLPATKHTAVTNTAQQASSQVQAYIQQLAAIPTSKTTYINIITTRTTVGHAYGGIIGAMDSGGLGSGFALVGESGPELVRLPQGSSVMSNPDTQNYMMGGGGAPATVTLQVMSGGGSAFEQFMLVALRNWVRVHGGGNVQTALGRTL